MSGLKCLENIVGLSKKDCPCYDENKPVNADVSKSGYYLDELQGLNLKLIGSDIKCGEGNVWGKMEQSLISAKNVFKTDFLMSITHEAKSKKPFTGRIGEFKSRKSLIASNAYLGLVMRANNIKGSQFTLSSIMTLMDADANFDLLVFNNLQDAPLMQISSLQAQANKSTDNALDNSNGNFTFPLYSEDCDYLEYYFVYIPDGFNPRDNKVHCGCSRKQTWEYWIDLQGISGDEIGTIDERDAMPSDGFANGLILNMTINCQTQDLICGGENEDLDYMNDPIARVIAAAIQYKAGEILLNDILSSGSLNRYTMLGKEALYGKRNHYASEYGMRMNYLGENVDISLNDCLSCDDNRINRTSILS